MHPQMPHSTCHTHTPHPYATPICDIHIYIYICIYICICIYIYVYTGVPHAPARHLPSILESEFGSFT